MLDTSIADRDVKDYFVEMSEAERELYDAVEGYIRTTYNQAASTEKGAVGFVMTTYRRRLASSIQALRVTLERHRAAIESGETTGPGGTRGRRAGRRDRGRSPGYGRVGSA